MSMSAALLEAIERGDENSLRSILQQSPSLLNQGLNSDGDTALHWGCHSNHLHLVQILLSYPAININSQTKWGATPLVWASSKNRVEIVELFLTRSDIDVNRTQHEGLTALMEACKRGYADVVRLLLSDRRVNREIKSNTRMTAKEMISAPQRSQILAIQRLFQIIPSGDSSLSMKSSSAPPTATTPVASTSSFYSSDRPSRISSIQSPAVDKSPSTSYKDSKSPPMLPINNSFSELKISHEHRRLVTNVTSTNSLLPPPPTRLATTTSFKQVSSSTAPSSEVSITWRCKHHNCLQHDIFMNYRTSTDRISVLKLLRELNKTSILPENRPPIVFLDANCLPPGLPWQDGFLTALNHSKVIVLVISVEGLQGIRRADEIEDNVLLEYEYTLKLMKERKVRVLPVLLANSDGRPFNQFNVDIYPSKKHISRLSVASGTIRETMRELFQLQGEHCPRDGAEQELTVLEIIRLLQ